MGQSTKTVMIVDGNPAMRYYHALLLMRLQYVAVTAWTPEEALARIERTLPSLILTAGMSLGLNGTDFIKTLKTNDRTRNIPVIALIDENDVKLRLSCRAQGCADCLNKPVDPQQLFQSIQTITEASPRTHIRFHLAVKTIMDAGIAPGKTEQETYTSMISEGGFYVRTHAKPPKRTRTPVKLIISDRVISTRAEVLYHTDFEPRMSREPGMGLKFIDLAIDDRIFLRSFIREQLVHDILPGKSSVA